MKSLTSTLAKVFVCELCVDTKEGIVEPGEKISFFDQVDFVKSFCYLEDRLNASGKSKAAVTTKTRIGWIKFRECGCNNNNLENIHFIIPCQRSFSVLANSSGISPYTNRRLFILFSKQFCW